MSKDTVSVSGWAWGYDPAYLTCGTYSSLTFALPMEYTQYEDSNSILVDVLVPGYSKDNVLVKVVNKEVRIEVKQSSRQLEKRTAKLTTQLSRYASLTLPLKNEQLLSYPEVTLANGVLTLTWLKNPKVELKDTPLTIK